ncbi:MAG: hypothetical protein K1X94_18295 [Sandaracinaceae bacterium]|nr:hypothetical protein [Sandaracinaceae bacterium]
MGSTEGVIGYRASRMFEIRALGSLGLGPGAVDAFDANELSPGWPTRLGLGVVLGFASDSEPFQLQLAIDAGIVGLAESSWLHREVRECRPDGWLGLGNSCTEWRPVSSPEFRSGIDFMPYARAVAVAGIDLTPSVRILAQGGLVLSPMPDGGGDVIYDAILAIDLSAEWDLDANTSLLLSGSWAHFDSLFVHGPSFGLGLRSVLPDTGPGSRRRHEERRMRVIDRRWQRARTDEWNQRYPEGPHPPRSMLESRHPVPDWMWSLLGARSAWEPAPRAEEPRDTSTAREESGSEDQSPEDQRSEDQSPEDQSPEDQSPQDPSPEESGRLESHGP